MKTIVENDKKRKKIVNLLIERVKEDDNFKMSNWITELDCGTSRCIGGWLQTLIRNDAVYMSIKKISKMLCDDSFFHTSDLKLDLLQQWLTGTDEEDTHRSLFKPELSTHEGTKGYRSFTKKESLKVLKHFRDTGVVDWKITINDEADVEED